MLHLDCVHWTSAQLLCPGQITSTPFWQQNGARPGNWTQYNTHSRNHNMTLLSNLMSGGVSPHHQEILWPQPGVCRFYSILTLFAQRQYQLSPVKGSVPPDGPHFRCQSPAQVVTCVSDWLPLRGSSNPILGFDLFTEVAHRTQRNISLTRLAVDSKRM